MKTNAQRIKGRIKSFMGQMIFGFHLHYLLVGNAAVVVAFHRVNETTVGDGLTCSTEMFKQYCRLFARHFDVVSLGDLIRKMEKGVALGGQLAITFDDGYRDNYEYAAPLLKAMGLTATFFVVTQFVESEQVPWWDRDRAVRQRHPWMSWDQVRSLYREGFEIGAHTRTHADMGRISGEKAREEIVGSRVELEEKLSAAVDLFAYPYGGEEHMTEENRQIVKAAGFRCCCSCFGGANGRGTDPFHLRRIAISSWYRSPHHFGFELALHRS